MSNGTIMSETGQPLYTYTPDAECDNDEYTVSGWKKLTGSDWEYFELTLPASTLITLSGTDTGFIDELRIKNYELKQWFPP